MDEKVVVTGGKIYRIRDGAVDVVRDTGASTEQAVTPPPED